MPWNSWRIAELALNNNHSITHCILYWKISIKTDITIEYELSLPLYNRTFVRVALNSNHSFTYCWIRGHIHTYIHKRLKCSTTTSNQMLKYNKNNYKSTSFFMSLCCILNVYLSFLFVCTESLTLVSGPTSRRFIRWLLFQTLALPTIYWPSK